MSQHHDPVHPDAGHLSAELLADLDLGLLDDESATHARQHLDHCEQCQALSSDLGTLIEVLHGLGDAPTETMPDDVWSRLAGALAAEPVSTPEGSATVVPLAPERRRRRPGIGLVAGAAGIALLGAIGVSIVTTNDDTVTTLSGDSSADGPTAESAGPPSAAFAASRSGTVYKQDQLDEQVVELVAARRVMSMDSSTASPSVDATASTSPSPETSKTLTDEPTLDSNAGQLLRSAGPMATDPAAAQACLEDYLDVDGIAPLAIDIGFWQGQPAAVIVLPLSDPALAQVWIINPTCDATSTQDPLYYFATVSR